MALSIQNSSPFAKIKNFSQLFTLFKSSTIPQEDFLNFNLTNPSFFKTIIDNHFHEVHRDNKPKLSLEETQFLFFIKFDLLQSTHYSSDSFNLEAYEFLLTQYDFAKTYQFFLYSMGFKRFNLLLSLQKINIQDKFKIEILSISQYHSLYYFAWDEKTARYLYENGLDIYENFNDLLNHDIIKYFYDDIILEKLTLTNINKYLIYMSYRHYIINDDLKHEPFIKFIEKILAKNDYASLKLPFSKEIITAENDADDQFSHLFGTLYTLWKKTKLDFIKQYLQVNLTEEIFLNYFQANIENKNYIKLNKLIGLTYIYGFEKLPFAFHQKLFKHFNKGKFLGKSLKKLKALDYPNWNDVKNDYLEKFKEFLDEKEADMTFRENFLKHILNEDLENMKNMSLYEILNSVNIENIIPNLRPNEYYKNYKDDFDLAYLLELYLNCKGLVGMFKQFLI